MTFNKEFLEDEVRLGFYIPSTIKQAWAAELEVLNVIDEICTKLGINYFADWGTLLGAIRHRGFIPWDDDLDLVMKREDYDRFYNEAPSLFPEGYSIHTFRNEEGFKEFHAVVVNAKAPNFNKEQFDRFHGFCYLCGIDIFILDYVHMDEEKEDERVKDALYLISLADSIYDGEMSSENLRSNIEYAEKITKSKLSHIKDNKELAVRIYELADAKCAEVTKEESDIITQMVPWGLKKQKHRRYSKADYDNIIRVPFEYTSVPLPAYYDRLLTKRYGEYMRIHKAGGAHEYPFFEKQIKDLETLLGSRLPRYEFSADRIERKHKNSDNWKTILTEAKTHLDSFKAIIRYDDSEESIDAICSSQELAIDIGNLIEQIKGESHESIAAINYYCENLYHLYSMLLGEEQPKEDILDLLENSYKSLSKSIDGLLNKKEIVFLPYKASAWNSFEDIYNICVKDDSFDVYVVPIPYYFKEYDGTLADEHYDLKAYPDYLNIIAYIDFSLELHHPDMIFIQNPYDEFNASTSIHPLFYSSVIKEFTDTLIYIPWFKTCRIDIEEGSRSYKNLDSYVTVPGVVNSDYTLLMSQEERDAYILKLKEWSKEDIWQGKIYMNNNEMLTKLGIMSESEIKTDNKPGDKTKKYLMYYIGAGQTFQNSKIFLKKFKEILNSFENNLSNISLALVLDCRLEDTMRKYNPDLWSELEIELERIKAIEGIQVICDDIEKGKLLLCDAYYGDASFLACEYSEAGKPVMLQKYDF